MPSKKSTMSEALWTQAAGLAYAGYQVKGRGAVIVDLLKIVSPVPGQPNEKYMGLEELRAQGWLTPEVLATVEGYDPETDIVALAVKFDGSISVASSSADDGPTPRQVYDQVAAKLGKPTKQ